MCHIKRDTKLAKLLIETSLIIWVKALMTNKQCFQTFDRSIKDITANQRYNGPIKDIMAKFNKKNGSIPLGRKVVADQKLK